MSFVVITPASLLGGLFTGIWYVTTGINFILLEESLVGQRQILGVVISFAVGVLTHPKMFAVIKLVALGRPIQFFNSHVNELVLYRHCFMYWSIIMLKKITLSELFGRR